MRAKKEINSIHNILFNLHLVRKFPLRSYILCHIVLVSLIRFVFLCFFLVIKIVCGIMLATIFAFMFELKFLSVYNLIVLSEQLSTF